MSAVWRLYFFVDRRGRINDRISGFLIFNGNYQSFESCQRARVTICNSCKGLSIANAAIEAGRLMLETCIFDISFSSKAPFPSIPAFLGTLGSLFLSRYLLNNERLNRV